MKSLNDYTNERFNKIFEEHGVFYAFSKKQFDESAKEGVTYESGPSGMICPKGTTQIVLDKMDKVIQEAIQQDIAENTIEGIIERELVNYECFYVGDITEAVAALKCYDVTEDQVLDIYRKTYDKNTQDL